VKLTSVQKPLPTAPRVATPTLIANLALERAPIRVNLVAPRFVDALAVHLMINTTVTGATYDIDGAQQFVA
jgi:hypothetical protein